MKPAGKNILLVDDDPGMLSVSARFLSSASYSVAACASAAEAAEKISSGNYDLLITDYHLGDGTGPDLISLLKLKNPGAKGLIITGDRVVAGTWKTASPHDDTDVLMKPFQMDKFLKLVTKLANE